MKTTNLLALGFATLALAALSHAQQPATATTRPSVRDNPGTLGTSYAEFNYTWQDNRYDADSYDLGIASNIPLRRGIDLTTGYDYFWANGSHNPFTLQSYDTRFHTLTAGANFFSPIPTGPKPYVGANVGFRWSHGDLESLRIYDHEWLWNVAGGVEIPMGTWALTPHGSYTDSMRRSTIGTWHVGTEANHWFAENLGGYFDTTFNVPNRGAGSQSWTFTAGMRFRY